ncbi:hypothetical protein BDW59DRAFT_167802 [Aspergillus cavernicola]|uniref:Uncharacterized protein n=1 Tax=Aspergillus cavernicola TaxID=176166 RepID=A0ABR4HAG7_9EURO
MAKLEKSIKTITAMITIAEKLFALLTVIKTIAIMAKEILEIINPTLPPS